MTSVVICMGNEGRGDDGVALAVGRALLSRVRGRVRVLTPGSLDIGLCGELAGADRVVFVDAEVREEPPVRTERVVRGGSVRGGHAVSPAALLATARALYGTDPEAWMVSVAARETAHGRELSEETAAAVPEAVSAVLALLG